MNDYPASRVFFYLLIDMSVDLISKQDLKNLLFLNAYYIKFSTGQKKKLENNFAAKETRLL